MPECSLLFSKCRRPPVLLVAFPGHLVPNVPSCVGCANALSEAFGLLALENLNEGYPEPPRMRRVRRKWLSTTVVPRA